MTNSYNYKLELIKTQITQSKSPNARLVAVSKFFPAESIIRAYQSGATDFAENFAQEFADKVFQLNSLNITWHFIGNIQSNKTKLIAENADYVHSLTQKHHAKRLNDQRPSDKNKLKVLIEVNISDEENKHGLRNFNEISDLVNYIITLPNLELVGLMGMASNTQNKELLQKQFNQLNNIKSQLNSKGFNLTELSIGTSNDYLIALDNHSTMIRVGSKIFGERNYDN